MAEFLVGAAIFLALWVGHRIGRIDGRELGQREGFDAAHKHYREVHGLYVRAGTTHEMMVHGAAEIMRDAEEAKKRRYEHAEKSLARRKKLMGPPEPEPGEITSEYLDNMARRRDER